MVVADDQIDKIGYENSSLHENNEEFLSFTFVYLFMFDAIAMCWKKVRSDYLLFLNNDNAAKCPFNKSSQLFLPIHWLWRRCEESTVTSDGHSDADNPHISCG